MARRLVTAHQANYLPYPGFFEKIGVADLFVLVDDTQFVKRGPFGWIHRNRILGAGAEALWLTVPVKTHDRYLQKIGEVEIDGAREWRRKHWKSLQFCYRSAPFFAELGPRFEALYERDWKKLLPLSAAMIELILDILGIRTPIILSSSLGLEGKGSDYVLELARKTEATHYLSGVHGRDYLDLESFSKAGVGLVFQDFECLPYAQGAASAFVPRLSIIDALFFAGPEGTRRLLEDGSRYQVPEKG